VKALLVLVALLFAAPASADLWVHGCTVSSANCIAPGSPYDCCDGLGTGTCPIDDANGVVGKTTIRGLERGCWTYTNADLATVNSPLIKVTGDVRICSNESLIATASTTTDVDIRRCSDGGRPTANPNNVCASAGAIATTTCLTTQGAGSYYVDITAVCTAGTVCRISFEGVDPQRQ
jgi:hypothetical protein